MSLKTQRQKIEPRGATGVDERAPVAWIITVYDNPCVVFASRRSKAKMVAVRAWWEAYGNRHRTFPPTTIHRAKSYDISPLRREPIKVWSEDCVMDSLRK